MILLIHHIDTKESVTREDWESEEEFEPQDSNYYQMSDVILYLITLNTLDSLLNTALVNIPNKKFARMTQIFLPLTTIKDS